MRAFAVIAGSLALLWASACPAAPPVYPRGLPAGLAAGRFAAGLPAPRLPVRPLGVDAPERARRTAGVTLRGVVILLQFTDMPADTVDHTPADFDTLLFSQGVVPTGSMRDYYNETSLGQFDITGFVTKWYTAPRPYSDYTNNQGGFGGAPFNAQQMALDAIRLADPDVDFSQFDGDGDGVVDGIFIVHAGPGGEETGQESDIWSHKWNLPGGAASVDGILAFPYTTEPERWGITTPWTTAGQLMTIGVFCHEFGHVLGLPDLYDTSGAPGASEGLGEWDLMASGLYTHRYGETMGSSPAHQSAFCKVQLGWVEPVWVLQDSTGVTVPPVETSGRVFRLWTNGVDASEYFLLENRQPIGFDAGLVRNSIEDNLDGNPPSHGLLIYHVDGGIIGNNDASHKMVDVEEGGGVESAGGFTGVQNLDWSSGSSASQTVCEGTVSVRGNRGDRYDPWPGLAARTTFDPTTCPNSNSYCGGISQVSVQNVAEVGQSILADFYVGGTTVRRRAVVMDDSPLDGFPNNNGNGLAEPGETVRFRFPLLNLGNTATGELSARVQTTSLYIGLLADSIYYGAIPGAASDSGTTIYAAINSSPDPEGVSFHYVVNGPAGLVMEDSVQVLLGQRSGICEDFEGTSRLWVAIPAGCGGVNEWHRESGINHTPGGTWAWRLGPSGLIGHYAPSEDARLVSQPIRLEGIADTLRFWQRYDTQFAFDGLSVEISTNSGATWTPLTPVGGYNTGDKWSGTQTTFTEAAVPLTGYSGVVQIAFRFTSQPPDEGLGWWIDDVLVTGDAPCATTAIELQRFDASAPAGEPPSVRLDWTVSRDRAVTVGIDRAAGSGARSRIATIPGALGDGAYVDLDVAPGGSYRYWLVVSRAGETSVEAGPVPVRVPAEGDGAPRALTLGRIRPNPFNPRATIPVTLDRDAPFVLRVYRADGSAVRTLAQGRGVPSDAAFTWDGTDDHGRPVGSGVYLFELRSGNRTRVQKAVLLR
ncbi:MAG TPA: M6 family metalloprotease domain-containing protein [Candidatus Eisenbacteria bacterium]